jgi:hypothetical protein
VERCSVGFSKKCKSKVQHQYVTFNIAEKWLIFFFFRR